MAYRGSALQLDFLFRPALGIDFAFEHGTYRHSFTPIASPNGFFGAPEIQSGAARTFGNDGQMSEANESFVGIDVLWRPPGVCSESSVQPPAMRRGCDDVAQGALCNVVVCVVPTVVVMEAIGGQE